MWLTYPLTYSAGDNILRSKLYPGTNYCGETNSYGSGVNMYKKIWLNNHDRLDYRTSNNCTHPWNQPNPQYVMNHEFGHFAGLSHHSFWPFGDTHTAMKTGCNLGQAPSSATDKININTWYD